VRTRPNQRGRTLGFQRYAHVAITKWTGRTTGFAGLVEAAATRSLVFEAVFGSTPHQFRIHLRLERAKHLLAAGRHSVTEVCLTPNARASSGVAFVREPTSAGPVAIAVFSDTCGNLIQLYQPA